MTIRTRFAPSPTGSLHIGGLRTAAYAYALAKRNKGDFLLRIEDTDQKREVTGAKQELLTVLGKFGLKWDEEPIIQSERVKQGVYQQAAEKLVNSGHAYRDQGAIRLKLTRGETVAFHDFVLDKEVSWKTDDVPEAVLLKSDGFPTYHLAVVVDDADMGITHVIRAVEWLPSTPIHILVYKYLGLTMPQIGHPTDILDPLGGKLSKRKGNVSCEQFLADGYLPEALLNFVILLGWAPKDNRELFTLPEFVEMFDINGFQKSNPMFNEQKLKWFNGYYIRQKSVQELSNLFKKYLEYPDPSDLVNQITPLIQERVATLKDINTIAKFFFVRPDPQPNLNGEYLSGAYKVIESKGNLQELVKARAWKMGDFFMTLRLAICGQKVTPPLTESMAILGREECLHRINQCLPN